MGLVNRHLVLSSFLNPLSDDDTTSTLAVGFFEKEVLQLLAENLNFTFTIQRPLDVSGPGLLVNNGSSSHWNGCMGQIHRKEIDACVTFTQITESEQRRMVADFSQPIIWEDIGMIMPAPRKLSRAFLIFYTFSFKIWLCIFFAALCVWLLLWLTYRRDEVMGARLNISRWFLYVLASLSIGERSFYMNNIGSRPQWLYRWMTVFWIFPASFVLIKVYTSVILSMSAVPYDDFLIKGISELPSRPDVTVFVYLGSNTDIFFSGQTEGEFKAISDQLSKNPKQRLTPSFNVSIAIEAIEKTKKAVFLASRSACQSIIDSDLQMRGPSLPPRLVLSDEIFMSSGRQIMFQKDSPLTELFNRQISLLRESGLIQQSAQSTMLWRSKTLKGQLSAHEQMNDKHIYLELDDLTGIFYILTCGTIGSMLAFLSEIV